MTTAKKMVEADMPKKTRELSAIEVKRLSKVPGFHAVGGVSCLYLNVTPTACSWIFRKVIGNKRRDIGLGPYPDVGVGGARERAREVEEQIRQGIDPVDKRKAAKEALVAAHGSRLTFAEAARQCNASKALEFRNAKHRKDWISSLEMHAFPAIGAMQVSDIELAHVLKVLEPIWQTRTETATRVRQRTESVLTWAAVAGYRKGENPARWEGNLKEVLPNPAKIAKVRHHRALPWQEVSAFMADLRQREGMGARALEFAILTAARSGEVRGATWQEFDMQQRIWTVPADRIKAGRAHKVPLSDAAVALLEALPRFANTEYVFPAARGGRISDMTLSGVCKRMEVDATPHGFRSTFKDWCRSRTNYPDEVSELALAHVNSDATRAAYARDELLPQRARLMDEWARYCSTVQPVGEVVAIGRRN